MKRLLKKIWIYLKPFCNWRFLVSYSIPFMVVNGWAWIGVILIPVIGMNWFTSASLSWQAILWLPCTPEKLITIPATIFIQTRLFKNDKKTKAQLEEMYAEAKKDWQTIKNKFRRNKNNDN